MDYFSPGRPDSPPRSLVHFRPHEWGDGPRARLGKPNRAFLMWFSAAVLIYSLLVLLIVAYMGDIGIRCFFTTEIQEPVSGSYEWTPGATQSRRSACRFRRRERTALRRLREGDSCAQSAGGARGRCELAGPRDGTSDRGQGLGPDIAQRGRTFGL